MRTDIIIRLLTYYTHAQVELIDINEDENEIYLLQIMYYYKGQLLKDLYKINNLIGVWDVVYVNERI